MKWKSVDKELPKYGGEYLIMYEDGEWEKGHWDGEKWRLLKNNGIGYKQCPKDITAWMEVENLSEGPLPPGSYTAELDHIISKKAKVTNREVITYYYIITKGMYKGRTIFDTTLNNFEIEVDIKEMPELANTVDDIRCNTVKNIRTKRS